MGPREGKTMKRRRKPSVFRSDREAADSWANHDSAGHAKGLPAVTVKASPALRQRVAAHAKKPVTLRLEEGQIATAKRVAERMAIPYQTLLRTWIAERLTKERIG
jgi:predicted DNA binding CopG/RHH family protein